MRTIRLLPLLIALSVLSALPASAAAPGAPAGSALAPGAPPGSAAVPGAPPEAATFPGTPPGSAARLGAPSGSATPSASGWQWPVDGPRRVTSPYRAPAHRFGPGHRGIDIDPSAGGVVRAPAAGVVAFRGVVVDRPILTIEHPGGYVTTFEPLESMLSAGDSVNAGDVVGTVSSGGHVSVGQLHLGVRLNGEYINPLLLWGPVPRAVLLPCCDDG
jgi:murein DD-endopeptidase MepM/ murein hydrolase activator NlpD